MKIVITGGLGFIGSHLAEKLNSAGYSVSVVSHKKEIPAILQKAEGIKYQYGNYGDRFFMKNILAGTDLVIHAACTTVPENSTKNPVYDIETNVIPSLSLLENCVEEKVKKIIFLSSGGAVYGKNISDLHREEDALNPISSYGISKITIEKYIRLYEHLYGLNHCIVRISNAYGPGQSQARNQGVIGAWLHQIKNNSPIEIWGDGKIIRDYIFINDIAEAILLAIRKNCSGTFNLGTGTEVSLNELLHVINTTLNINVPPVYKESRGFDVKKNVLDATKFRNATGWKPETSLEKGILATFSSLY